MRYKKISFKEYEKSWNDILKNKAIKQRTNFIAFAGFMFFLCLIVMLYLAVWLYDERTKAIANPIQYALKEINKNYDADASCTLSLNKKDYVAILITANNSYPLFTYSGETKKNPNLTLIFPN